MFGETKESTLLNMEEVEFTKINVYFFLGMIFFGLDFFWRPFFENVRLSGWNRWCKGERLFFLRMLEGFVRVHLWRRGCGYELLACEAV